MFGALRDCVLPLKQARHDPPELLLDAFNQEISKYFDEVKPISKPLQKEQRFWAKQTIFFSIFWLLCAGRSRQICDYIFTSICKLGTEIPSGYVSDLRSSNLCLTQWTYPCAFFTSYPFVLSRLV
jgi:hypothetical protein